MGRIFKLLLRGLLVLVVLALAFGLWKREEIQRLLAVNSLFSPEKIVDNFSNMDAAFLTTPVGRGNGPVSPLPQGAEMALPTGTDHGSAIAQSPRFWF